MLDTANRSRDNRTKLKSWISLIEFRVTNRFRVATHGCPRPCGACRKTPSFSQTRKMQWSAWVSVKIWFVPFAFGRRLAEWPTLWRGEPDMNRRRLVGWFLVMAVLILFLKTFGRFG